MLGAAPVPPRLIAKAEKCGRPGQRLPERHPPTCGSWQRIGPREAPSAMESGAWEDKQCALGSCTVDIKSQPSCLVSHDRHFFRNSVPCGDAGLLTREAGTKVTPASLRPSEEVAAGARHCPSCWLCFFVLPRTRCTRMCVPTHARTQARAHSASSGSPRKETPTILFAAPPPPAGEQSLPRGGRSVTVR